MTYESFGLLMAPAEGGSPGMALLVQLGLIFVIFYWLLIRPQQKERKRHDQMVAALGRGDEVATVGGIVGTVVHVEGDKLTIKSGDTRIVVERDKVGRKLGDESGGGT